jgi:hypothetical protein
MRTITGQLLWRGRLRHLRFASFRFGIALLISGGVREDFVSIDRVNQAGATNHGYHQRSNHVIVVYLPG